MSDAFKINWTERMKTDPKANSIMNNDIDYESFLKYDFQYDFATNRWRGINGSRFTRRLNELYSERYIKDWRDFPQRYEGRYRYDQNVGDYQQWRGDNWNKYWDNTIPPSVYNHKSIAQAENPKMEALASLPVYQKKM